MNLKNVSIFIAIALILAFSISFAYKLQQSNERMFFYLNCDTVIEAAQHRIVVRHALGSDTKTVSAPASQVLGEAPLVADSTQVNAATVKWLKDIPTLLRFGVEARVLSFAEYETAMEVYNRNPGDYVLAADAFLKQPVVCSRTRYDDLIRAEERRNQLLGVK